MINKNTYINTFLIYKNMRKYKRNIFFIIDRLTNYRENKFTFHILNDYRNI